jgi:transposase
MKFNWFIGIDVSKNTLDISIRDSKSVIHVEQIENSEKSLKACFKDFKKLDVNIKEALICMEHTGVYCTPVIEIAEKLKLSLWIENASQIKLSIGVQRGKNDKIDSIRIADYAYRFQDKVKLKQPDRASMKELKSLVTARKCLVENLKQLKVVAQEKDHYLSKALFAKYFKKSIGALKTDLAKIEKQIQVVINNDERLNELYNLVTSVKGIGKVVGVHMIITTNEFIDINEPKKYACYAGVAPFEHSSGISINGRKRVSRQANMGTKSLLHMAAVIAIQHNKEIKDFFERKVREGKAKMNVINMVRNKLIHRVFACVRDNRKYENIYVNSLA